MDVLKLIAMAAVCVVAVVLVREYRPESVPLVQLAGIVLMSTVAIEYVGKILSETSSLASLKGLIDEGYIKLLVKVLGIAVITQIASDMCRDSGNNALAFSVELLGRAMILAMSFSLIRAVAELASGLLG